MPTQNNVKPPRRSRSDRLADMHCEVLGVEGAAKVLGVSRWTILKCSIHPDLAG